MKKILLVLVFFVSLTILATLTHPASADWIKLANTNCLESSGGQKDVVTFDCIPQLFANLVYWAILLSGTVALFFVIFGGIKLLTSGGDAKKVEDSRKTITWALIGLVVVLMSFGIVAIVAQTTGVSCITKLGFTSCGNTDSPPSVYQCTPACTAPQTCQYDSNLGMSQCR